MVSSEVSMTTELEKFYSAIESIDTAMMTTRRRDGHMRSRAMAVKGWVTGTEPELGEMHNLGNAPRT
jgi:general stress protein 26